MAFCSNCGTAFEGNFCSVYGQGTGQAMQVRQAAIVRPVEKHGVPALLSFFIPGLGQLIKGDVLGALFVFTAAVAFGLLCFAIIGFVLLPILWVWQIYDAYVAPDGPTKRELKRLANLAIVLACAITISGCGSVMGDAQVDGGGGTGAGGSSGGAAAGGKVGTPTGTGGTAGGSPGQSVGGSGGRVGAGATGGCSPGTSNVPGCTGGAGAGSGGIIGTGNTTGSGNFSGTGGSPGSGNVTGSGNSAGAGGVTGAGNTTGLGGSAGAGNAAGSGGIAGSFPACKPVQSATPCYGPDGMPAYSKDGFICALCSDGQDDCRLAGGNDSLCFTSCSECGTGDVDVPPCQPGQIQCGTACVNYGTDAANCGGCGVACGPGQTCQGSACTGSTDCSQLPIICTNSVCSPIPIQCRKYNSATATWEKCASGDQCEVTGSDGAGTLLSTTTSCSCFATPSQSEVLYCQAGNSC